MDDDPVLRSLGEDLAQDDPRLAELLSDTHPVRRHRHTRAVLLVLLLGAPLMTVALLLPPTVALGATAVLLAVASPLVVCWLCAGDRPAPRLR